MAAVDQRSIARMPEAFKVCLVGAEGAGKTSLVIRITEDSFEGQKDSNSQQTPENASITFTVDAKSCKLDIIDIGDKGLANQQQICSSPHAFVAVFSVRIKATFEWLPSFIKFIEKLRPQKDYALLLVGSQVDDEEGRVITKEQALEFAYNNGCNYFEVSAKTGLNVKEVFEDMVREIRTLKRESEMLASLFSKKDLKKATGKSSSITNKFLGKERKLEHIRKKEEQKNNRMDSALSILKNETVRKSVVSKLPKIPVVPLKAKTDVATVVGPSPNYASQTFRDVVCARGVPTYPRKSPDSDEREGDPIADQYCMTLFENRTLVALADGCNWGPEVQLAAKKSARVFNEYMRKHQREIFTTREVGYIMLRAFMAAHNSIIEGRNEETLFQAGTSTMLAGMVLELETEEATNIYKWGFAFASLGDCKAYHWNHRTGDVRDITEGNRGNITDAKDPGGRLGPYLDGGSPDLRNLDIYWHPCNEGDIIFLCSDGVHDNLDPEHLGKLPADLNIKVKDNSWENLESLKGTSAYLEAESVKSHFARKFLNAMIGGERSLRPESRTTPSSIVGKLVEHCLMVTKASRDWMESNPTKKLPKDYLKFPGKMDHSTIVAFEVGPNSLEKIAPVHKKTNTLPSDYWQTYSNDDGEKYFYNTITKKSTWEDPYLTFDNQDWKAYYDEDGEVYYYNILTQQCQWDPPEGYSAQIHKANSFGSPYEDRLRKQQQRKESQ
eukprot:TRINITY_DN2613_c0_g1_i1.p1 TRINITY_DN2613_c0_g1~~TRINITY_DN2613_c0_g1_i1.p1  ORF type:complete len:725 (+),score=162.52 TRINITY_DN2613_c0_g1_i1:188-2362(+)